MAVYIRIRTLVPVRFSPCLREQPPASSKYHRANCVTWCDGKCSALEIGGLRSKSLHKITVILSHSLARFSSSSQLKSPGRDRDGLSGRAPYCKVSERTKGKTFCQRSIVSSVTAASRFSVCIYAHPYNVIVLVNYPVVQEKKGECDNRGISFLMNVKQANIV